MYIDHVSATCFCQILMKLEFSRQIFEKKISLSNFIKIRPVGAELFHAGGQTDRQTDMTKVIVDFRNFANERKNCSCPRHEGTLGEDRFGSTHFLPWLQMEMNMGMSPASRGGLFIMAAGLAATAPPPPPHPEILRKIKYPNQNCR